MSGPRAAARASAAILGGAAVCGVAFGALIWAAIDLAVLAIRLAERGAW